MDSVSVIKLWMKALWEKKGLFQLTDCTPSRKEVRGRAQGRSLEAGTEAETKKTADFWLGLL